MTLLERLKKEVGRGKRAGVPSEPVERLEALERENCELRQASEMLRKASACSARRSSTPSARLPLASLSESPKAGSAH